MGDTRQRLLSRNKQPPESTNTREEAQAACNTTARRAVLRLGSSLQGPVPCPLLQMRKMQKSNDDDSICGRGQLPSGAPCAVQRQSAVFERTNAAGTLWAYRVVKLNAYAGHPTKYSAHKVGLRLAGNLYLMRRNAAAMVDTARQGPLPSCTLFFLLYSSTNKGSAVTAKYSPKFYSMRVWRMV